MHKFFFPIFFTRKLSGHSFPSKISNVENYLKCKMCPSTLPFPGLDPAPSPTWFELVYVQLCSGVMVEIISSSETDSATECVLNNISVFNLEILYCQGKASRFLFPHHFDHVCWHWVDKRLGQTDKPLRTFSNYLLTIFNIMKK